MSLPSLHLSEIPEHGERLVCVVEPAELDLGPTDDRFVGALSLDVELEKTDATVRVTGTLVGRCVRECVRCLREYEQAIALPIDVEFRHEAADAPSPAGTHTGDDEGAAELLEEEEPSADVYAYVGEQLELGEMLREQIILARPMQPLCREDCRGLCQICGQDLNERACGCQEWRRENPFEVLRRTRSTPDVH